MKMVGSGTPLSAMSLQGDAPKKDRQAFRKICVVTEVDRAPVDHYAEDRKKFPNYPYHPSLTGATLKPVIPMEDEVIHSDCDDDTKIGDILVYDFDNGRFQVVKLEKPTPLETLQARKVLGK